MDSFPPRRTLGTCTQGCSMTAFRSSVGSKAESRGKGKLERLGEGAGKRQTLKWWYLVKAEKEKSE